MALADQWYKNAIFYALDVRTYFDSNGDGIGDFRGLTTKIDYLDRLGVTALWLLPFYDSPFRDNGYDVRDHFRVQPTLGTSGDFVEFLRDTRDRGIRVIVDLVANHTSDQHPWFQSARADRGSNYHDYYVWSDDPADKGQRAVLPGDGETVWTWEERVRQYYFHHFFPFEPGLNLSHPAVPDELRRIMGYWLQLGVSGFRVDAAPFLIRPKGPTHVEGEPHELLTRFSRFARRRRADAILLAEADIDIDELPRTSAAATRCSSSSTSS